MFTYELHRAQHAELVRQADTRRLAREAARAGQATRTARTGRRSGRQETEGRVSTLADRFTRAA
ncbi:hypothetical protein AB0C52_02075 [Streptomyces sp. NPDC048717]|uniref:hypothetical protein n=1 Tax=unclassified Streptomyces TaxID=2593676 RepID=UPI00343ACE69